MIEQTEPVATNVANLLAELDEHRRRVSQALARDELADARDAHAERRADTRRKIILGGAAMAEAKADPKFAAMLMEILRRRVVDPRDRVLLALDMELAPEQVRLPSAEEFNAMAQQRLRPAEPRS